MSKRKCTYWKKFLQIFGCISVSLSIHPLYETPVVFLYVTGDKDHLILYNEGVYRRNNPLNSSNIVSISCHERFSVIYGR